MRRARWLVPWKDSLVRPVFYHCISRVVERRFAFDDVAKEKFRALMRMQETFTGCRVVSYCLMCNHIHILLEVPPLPQGGFSDEQLLARLDAIYSKGMVASIAAELAEARISGEKFAADIHARYTYRMHSLSEFMKTLLQKFTQWYNRVNARKGHLWEDTFKSVIVEDGVAAKTIAAYIDLNPVRAGMVIDPADYRFSSYGEAIGGGAKGNGKKARAGLVRALRAHDGIAADASLWRNISASYRKLLMQGVVEKSTQVITRDGSMKTKILRKGKQQSPDQAISYEQEAKDIGFAKMLRCRVRYFTDGAVIGSRGFVNEAFANARERFGKQRRDGARKLKGRGQAAAGILWSMRDLRV